uniref:Sodium/nucleoside cotransporter n=1 Tax=Panagrellus redivivus TaxID=6233 RepID=A0A7E4VTM7_PANRE
MNGSAVYQNGFHKSDELPKRQETWLDHWLESNKNSIKLVILVLIAVGAHVFVGFAIAHNFKKSVPAIVILGLIYLYFIVKYGSTYLQRNFKHEIKKSTNAVSSLWGTTLWGYAVMQLAFFGLIIAAFIVWLIFDAHDSPIRIRSLAAIIMYLLIGFLLSANPAKIKWRPVFGGIFLQFIVAFLVLRWETGNSSFRWASNQVVKFLDYATNGTTFVYGFVAAPPPICDFGSVFVYTSLQIIIYFGAIVSVLYYLGIIQAVLSKVAWLVQNTVGTTAAESLNAAACIFLGQTEAALLIEPALGTMTESEIHTVMTSGFACIAGSLFSAYISFGACPTYLLSATVMSAAVSLSISKLLYPEVQKSRQIGSKNFKFAQREERNFLECISNGAVHASSFIWAIAANLIVYMALLTLANTTVAYFGDRLGYEDWSFNKFMGYCFFPLAYMMGASDATDTATEMKETLHVAELMGMKTILNEFVAYQELMKMKADGRLMGHRAQMIATYALCGFSNISMIGSQIGILSAMCPKRRAVFAKVALRGLIAGCISCFMTASVAGVLVSQAESCQATNQGSCYSLSNITETLAPFIQRNLFL